MLLVTKLAVVSGIIVRYKKQCLPGGGVLGPDLRMGVAYKSVFYTIKVVSLLVVNLLWRLYPEWRILSTTLLTSPMNPPFLV